MPEPAVPSAKKTKLLGRPNTHKSLKKTPGVLTEGQKRSKRLDKLMSWLKPIPDEWIEMRVGTGDSAVGAVKFESKSCSNYAHLQTFWRKALKWRQELDDALSIALAVALSTGQQGDQLFLMLIGHAGSAKTRMCDALLVSKYCYALEHLTGFFSGFKGEDGKDYSVINRANGKMMITPEGDVLMSNPKSMEIMAQQRRIFDGVSGASYKNRDEDLRYAGLRTPWMIAGTPAMLDLDQSRLGDRFLKIFLGGTTDDQRQEILSHVSLAAFEAVQSASTGDNHVGKNLQAAYEHTGGYVDWLRENTHLLSEITCDKKFLHKCELLGDLIAYLRARPSKNEDSHPTREEPTRLTHQFVRLMACLTVVLNRHSVDKEVMRRVKRVAFDTGNGIGLKICKILWEEGNSYLPNRTFHVRLDYSKQTIDRHLKFMKQIGALQISTEDNAYISKSNKPYWKLSHRLYELCELTGIDQ